MRIAYCTNVRLPSERAHGHQIAQVCDALIGLGHEVTVFAPHRHDVTDTSFARYYGVSEKIKVAYIGNKRHLSNFKPFRPLRLWLMNRGLRRGYGEELTRDRFDLLYTRTTAMLTPLLESDIPTVLELHQLPRRGKRRFVREATQCALVAALTTPMKQTLLEWGVPQAKVIAEGDGVDLRRFASFPERGEAQRVFDLQTKRLVVGYVGRLKTLFMDKGVSDLLKALAAMKEEKRYMGFIVGGPEGDKKEYEAQAVALGLGPEDIVFTGEVPGADVPIALAACDVLAMPFPDKPHYRNHMSPLKMFEYMAAGRPIITSDLPTVRDVLRPQNAVFCKPGDVPSLVEALRWIAEHPADAAKRAMQARQDVENHTWEKRMQRILSAIHP